MSDPNAKSGPLTQDDLQAIWESAVDESYSRPFIEAGEGQGFEAYTQGFAQFARVSQAIDVTSQAMFVRPWSGQSNPSAQGGKFATVTLTFQRTQYLERPLRLAAGLIFVEEEQTDWGEDGGVAVLTGRRYVLTEDLVFLPGEQGPFNVQAQAEKVGYGYNNPLPNTISSMVQNGTGFNNSLASVAVTPGNNPPPPALQVLVTALNEADMFVPDHVGQYVLFTAGNNNGLYGRVTSFISPNPPAGSGVTLEVLCAIHSGTVTGAFQAGENVTIKSGATVVGRGVFLVSRLDGAGHTRIGFVLTEGIFANGDTMSGDLSAATATVDMTLYYPVFTSEAPSGGVGGASWRVLDWVIDFGITVTHAASPSGGTSAMLDELGNEKNLPRSPSETDSAYSVRQSKIADVVSPNAIRRTLNKTLGTTPWCFREVGLALLPGFFYDRVNDENGDFYDDDVIVFTGTVATGAFVNPSLYFQEPVEFQDSGGNAKSHGYFGRIDGGTQLTFIRKDGQGSLATPVVVAAGDKVVGKISGAVFDVTAVVATSSVAATRWHVYLDYTDFRAMFLVGVPRMSTGEFGFAYDNHPFGAYDATPYDDFYDGFAAGQATLLKQVWQNVDRIRAGGVSWYLYIEDGTCS